MSITHEYSIECDCGAIVDVTCCQSLNAERHPHLRDALLERTLHVFECGGCGRNLVVDKLLTYIDLERRQFCGVAPDNDRERERELAEDLVAAWNLALGEGAPVSVATLFQTDRFHVRLCFGLEELREKLVAADAGLDDLALEVYKAELLASNAEWAETGVRTLRLDHVEPDGRLAFHFERGTDSVLEIGVLVDRGRCDEIAARPWREILSQFPGIASGPHVSLLRLSSYAAS
jgi:hypothetical protein